MHPRSTDFAKPLLTWYARHRRDLPWRPRLGSPPGTKPNPYLVLVSEAMLQQTQVATVIPYFNRFLKKFPTLKSLAASDEQEVLRLWQGLGYYSRARNLRRAAQTISQDLNGQFPQTVTDLQKLPGIGPYTAGAIASIAFAQPAPILDGNVARVLCRLDAIRMSPRDRATTNRLWTRAKNILPKGRLAPQTGDFNSALMELGATICTPRNPKCHACPVSNHCQAFARNLTDKIPAPRKTKPTPLLHRTIYCLSRPTPTGPHWLLEQRPPKGRWASMWQFPTRPSTTTPKKWSHLSTINHSLTHRQYKFQVLLSQQPTAKIPPPPSERPTQWLPQKDFNRLPLPKPHLTAISLLP